MDKFIFHLVLNKITFYLIRFLMDIFIIGLIPVLLLYNVPMNIAVWFSIISYAAIDIRQWFVEKYGNNL